MAPKHRLTESDMLILVSGPGDQIHKGFKSIDELRAWQPTFRVTRARIVEKRPAIRMRAPFLLGPDGTRLRYQDGVLTISSPTIEGAIAAYNWAYGKAQDGTPKHHRPE